MHGKPSSRVRPRWGLVLAVCVLLLGAGLGPAFAQDSPSPRVATAPLPAADYFGVPAMDSPTLSPDGRHVAYIAPWSQEAQRAILVIRPLDGLGKAVGAVIEEGHVLRHYWLNNRRLVFEVDDLVSAGKDELRGPGLYAIDADGRAFTYLVARTAREADAGSLAIRPLGPYFRFYATVGEGSDEVVVIRTLRRERPGDRDVRVPVLLNTRTRAIRHLLEVDQQPADAGHWILAPLAPPRVRALTVLSPTHERLLSRAAGGKKWQLVGDSWAASGEPFLRHYVPLGVDAQDQLLVSIPVGEKGMLTPHTLDISSDAAGDTPPKLKPLLPPAEQDQDGPALFDADTGQLLGLTVAGPIPGRHWLEPSLRELQAEVDRRLPGAVNQIVCERCLKAERLMVWSHSDRQPPRYYVYRRTDAQLTALGHARPKLAALPGGAQAWQAVAARDGLQVPVLVTRPTGAGPWPTVVLLEDEPFGRGPEWGWQPASQFLASRGYLVLQPAPRGTRGHGQHHHRAGWQQVGLAALDDVADVTRWAIQKGLADARRIALMGQGLGGSSALMGVIKEPDLYRAAVGVSVVADVGAYLALQFDSLDTPDWRLASLGGMLGHPDRHRARLDAASPLKHAARLKRPVLLAHGELELREEIYRMGKLRNALQDARQAEVTWLDYPEDGPGIQQPDHRIDFWTRVEAFLGQHLK